MDKRLLVHNALNKLGIQICGAPSAVLGPLIDLVNNSLQSSGEYLFLWRTDGILIAHGLYPELESSGSVLNNNVASQLAIQIPGMSAYTLQMAFVDANRKTYAIGRYITYPWIGGSKTAYTILILIGDYTYILGS